MIAPIVEEVRKYRAERARELNFDIHAICAYIQEMALTCGHRVVSLPPRISPTAIVHVKPADQRLLHDVRALPVLAMASAATSAHRHCSASSWR